MTRMTKASLQFASLVGMGVLSAATSAQPMLEEVIVTASKRV